MNPLDQPCPRCKAQPGQTCNAPNGRYVPPHLTRQGKPEHTGRQSLINPDLITNITKAIAQGVPAVYAAKANGIGESTLYHWITLSTIDDPKYDQHRQLREELERARAEAVTKHVSLINLAAEGGYVTKHVTRTLRDGSTEEEITYAPMDWRASSFLLERLYREFGRREVLEWAASSDGLAAVESAGAGALSSQGVDRIAGQLRLYKERREIESGITDAEVVEES